MPRPALTAEQRTEQEARQLRQLLRGMAACLRAQPFAHTTIADVVRAARVSKSTFYAHFADKEACYVALYSAAVDNVLKAMREADAAATDAGLSWREHLAAVNAAYLSTLAIGGGMTRSMLVEFQTAGPSAQAMRPTMRPRRRFWSCAWPIRRLPSREWASAAASAALTSRACKSAISLDCSKMVMRTARATRA